VNPETICNRCVSLVGMPDAVVLSIDEKTGIQAKGHKHPTQPVRSGQPARREFEYVRHGTASLIAAMDVATGKVTATDIERNNSVTFIAFLEEIDKSIDDGLAIHIVMDNDSSHTSKATKGWLADHPRFVVHHTPAHAGWLNRGILLNPDPQAVAPGGVRVTTRTRRQDAGVHQPSQHHRYSIQMGLRRLGHGGMIHVQRTSARHH